MTKPETKRPRGRPPSAATLAERAKPVIPPVRKGAHAKPPVEFTRGARLSLAEDEAKPDNTRDFAEIGDPRKRLYLQGLTEYPRYGYAARRAGISPETGYAWRHDLSPENTRFLELIHVAYRLGVERAESEMWRQFFGVEEPVYNNGKLVGTRLSRDTTAGIFMLKGALPEKYRERTELTGRGGGPIQTESRSLNMNVNLSALSLDELQQMMDRARELAGSKGPVELPADVHHVQAAPDADQEELAKATIAYSRVLADRDKSNGNGGGNGSSGHG